MQVLVVGESCYTDSFGVWLYKYKELYKIYQSLRFGQWYLYTYDSCESSTIAIIMVTKKRPSMLFSKKFCRLRVVKVVKLKSIVKFEV